MPSASQKSETRAGPEHDKPIFKAIQVVDKKVRNLEKRKGKLDSYKEKAEKGGTLNEDQLKSVSQYDVVLQNLEFARDLQKQFLSINADAEKQLKKASKQDKLGKLQEDLKKIKEVLQIQNTLESFGSDLIRKDFLNGTRGAVHLNEETLTQFDDLHKLLNPTRSSDTSFDDSLNVAAEHFLNLVETREKDVLGTSYNALKSNLDMVSECSYFDNLPIEELEVVQNKDESENDKSHTVQSDAILSSHSKRIHPTGNEEVVVEDEDGSTITSTPQPLHGNNQETISRQYEKLQASSSAPRQPENVFMATSFSEATPQRGLNEIVSSVQGNFDFLQDSSVLTQVPSDSLSHSAHIDPAVVAAQPMHSRTQNDSSYQQPPMLRPEDHPARTSTKSVPLPDHTSHLDTYPSQSNQNSDYGQTFASQPSTEGGISFPQLNQASGALISGPGMGSMASQNDLPEPPPAIPMPHETSYAATLDHSQQQLTHEQQEQKFTMNPNAAMFQSRYNQGHFMPGQADEKSLQDQNSSQTQSKNLQQQQPYIQSGSQNEYQGSLGTSQFPQQQGKGGGASKTGLSRGQSGARSGGGGNPQRPGPGNVNGSNGYNRNTNNSGSYGQHQQGGGSMGYNQRSGGFSNSNSRGGNNVGYGGANRGRGGGRGGRGGPNVRGQHRGGYNGRHGNQALASHTA